MRKSIRTHATPLLIFSISLYFLVSIVIRKGYYLVEEDQLFESLTAAFYLVGALFCLVGFLAASRSGSRIGKYWLLGWAALFLFLALEEISWGQRLFGLESPGFFDSYNLQHETNIHNFASRLTSRSFYLFVFLVGIALPSLTMLSKAFASSVIRGRIPLPQRDLIVPFALAFAFFEPGWIADAPELATLRLAVFLWLAFVLAAKLRGRDERFAEWHTLQVAAGLGGLFLIQLVLTVF